MYLTKETYHIGRNTDYISLDIHAYFMEVAERLGIPYEIRGHNSAFLFSDDYWQSVLDYDYTQIMDDKEDIIQQLVFGINPKIEKLKSYRYVSTC